MTAKKKLKFILFLFININGFHLEASDLQYIFKNKKEGYNVYRIPAITQTKNGKLLAFCEGRKNLFDGGNIDIVMKTSDDNGKTWSKLKIIWNEGENTCGNPSPVLDRITGNIIMSATLNNDKVFVLTSRDEGNTWETPKEITKEVKPVNWKWYATGPVHAIQLKYAPYENRIIVPCNHTIKGIDKHISHIIFSDDNGITWKLGGSVPDEKTDECTIAELTSGNLLLNMRNSDRTLPNRKISYSKNGGNTWSSSVFDSTLVEPVCQGTLLRYSNKPEILLFANPFHKRIRKNLMLSVSYDEGISWTKRIQIHQGKSAYSDIVILENNDVLCLFETGKMVPYSGIAIKIIDSELINNK